MFWKKFKKKIQTEKKKLLVGNVLTSHKEFNPTDLACMIDFFILLQTPEAVKKQELHQILHAEQSSV